MNEPSAVHRYLWEAAKSADAAWSAELERVYGDAAGDARYDRRGRATQALSDLSAVFLYATDAWLAAMRKSAAEMACEPRAVPIPAAEALVNAQLVAKLTTLRAPEEYHRAMGCVLWWPVGPDGRPSDFPWCGVAPISDQKFWSPLPPMRSVDSVKVRP